MNGPLNQIVSRPSPRLPAIVAAAVLFFSTDQGLSQSANTIVHTGAPPAWVELIEPDASPSVTPESEARGQVYKLLDTQINAAKAETYVHIVKEMASKEGVQSGANLNFAWDPTYQELVFHRIAILRGTERLDQLDPARFKVIQQESDLNRQIYNGALSAVLFLEDVRTGDRIEYDYTLRGQNPSLGGKFSDSYLMGWPMAIQRRRIRLLWPEGRRLNYAAHGVNAEPVVRPHDGFTEYLWSAQHVPAVMLEDQIPSWFTPYPWLQMSEFADWQAVADWATGLFITTNVAAPELQQQLKGLRRPGHMPEQTVQEALQLVQNEVRYLGLEFGPNSYRATDPALVMRRRFGDCKDKAFLLCILLRELGFEADPVLVSAYRKTLPELIPAPHDFDHAIARVVVADKIYWLDPTRAYQRGPIAQRFRPAYGYGLIVKAGVTNLTPIPDSAEGAPYSVTSEVFRLGGQKAPAHLNVTNVYTGFDAEWMRAVLNSQGREQVAKGYLNDYAKHYPGLTPSTPMAIADSPDRDALTITHSYLITNFWALSTDKQRYTCQFFPHDIQSWVTRPVTSVRSMPMELSYPRACAVRTRIELPRLFKLSDLTNTIEGPGAQLRIEHRHEKQTVWLNYEYRALTNLVPVTLVAKHLESLARMENSLGYSLTWQNLDNAGKPGQFNWPIFLLAIIYTTAFAGGTGILCYHQCKKAAAQTAGVPPLMDQPLSGLGGWLVLVCIRLFLEPLLVLVGTVRSTGSFAIWKWQSLTSPGGMSYNPLWCPLLTFELLCRISTIILAIILLALFFQKRSIFPRWFIALLVIEMIFVLSDTVGTACLGIWSPNTIPQKIGNAFGCGLWIRYMLVSKRVKATFVR